MAIQPVKLLTGSTTIIDVDATWNEDTGDGDLFVGYPYKWKIGINVNPMYHSSPSTPTPFMYDGNDIKAGFWLAGFRGGQACVVITEILYQDSSYVEAIVEDYERFNIMTDPYMSGSGFEESLYNILFELSDSGTPLLTGTPNNIIQQSGPTDLISRFEYRNIYKSYVSVYQPFHSFNVGDLIAIDLLNQGHYILADDTGDISNAIGVVTDINIPGTEYFNYSPIGKLVNNLKEPLVGNYGDVFYIDPSNDGKLTNIKPFNSAKPIYMRLDLPTRAILLQDNITTSAPVDNYKRVDVNITEDQETEFVMPSYTKEVVSMNINGIENFNYVFDNNTKIVTFDAETTGYYLETTDEVFFIVTK